jgi:hypothetical protein
MNPLILGGVGQIAETIGKIADDLFTSDEERSKADLEAMQIGLEAARVDAGLIAGQQEINKVEAQHASVFVAGWRPAIGWVGVAALAYQYILYPMMTWLWAWLTARGWVPAEVMPPPILDIEALMVLMTGILGIAGARTFEKVRGIQPAQLKGTAK